MKRASVWMIVSVCGGVAVATSGCKSEKRDDKPAPPAAAASAKPEAKPDAAAPAQAERATETTPAPVAPTPGADVSRFSGPDAYETKAQSRVDLPSGLVIEDLRIGEGPSALPGAVVTFHYRGKLEGGKEFDCTLDREGGPKPEEHPINKLFPGLTNGMIGMKAGGRRRLTIPPYLAPGIVGMKDSDGIELIPPNATLIYVIDMLDIKQQLAAPATPPAAEKPASPANGGGKP